MFEQDLTRKTGLKGELEKTAVGAREGLYRAWNLSSKKTLNFEPARGVMENEESINVFPAVIFLKGKQSYC